MPNRTPAVRYTEARHSSMRTSFSSAGVSWRTLMGYSNYARNRACTLLSPSPFLYVMAEIMPVVESAAHAKISSLYGRSYGRTSKFFRLDGLLKFFLLNELLLFRIIMGLCYARFALLWWSCLYEKYRGPSWVLNNQSAAFGPYWTKER